MAWRNNKQSSIKPRISMGILYASKSRANNELYRLQLDIRNFKAIDEDFPQVRTSLPSCGKRLSTSNVYD
jgi:hypothetical protein